MRCKSLSLIIAVAALPCALAGAVEPDAAEALSSVAKVLGAEGLKSLEYSGSGTSFALGQAGTVGAAWPKFNDKSYQRTVSFEPWGSKLQRIRTQGETPPRGGGGQPIVGEQNQTQVVAPASPAAAALADELALALPQGFVKAAAAASDTSAKLESRNGKKYTVIQFTAGNKAITRGWVNEQNLLERVQTTVDHVVLGDTPYEVVFTGYQDFGSVKFPGRIQQTQGGYPVLDLNVTDVKINVPVEFPAASPPPPQPALAIEQLADGIHLITGGYAAVVIDFKDHVTVIEGGQNDQRSEAVIAEVKRLIPGKPITESVNTHAHFDHLGGVRAYVAEGATIVTHRSNPGYYQKVWKNPHTLAPDRLQRNPRAKFKTVNDKLTLTDGEKVVELYHLKDFGHHDGTLIAYLPQQKILVQADAFKPPAAPLTQTPAVIDPYHQSLLANIEQRGLDVQRIIPVHLPADNRKIILAELQTAVGKQ